MPNINPGALGKWVAITTIMVIITVSVVGGLHNAFGRPGVLGQLAGVSSIFFGFLMASALSVVLRGDV